MQVILDFLMNYWGIIGVVVLFGIELYREREVAVKRIRDLMFLAEEKGRKHILKTGEEKFNWVLDNGYAYMPPILKTFVSKDLFAALVQSVYDQIMKWADEHALN